MAQSVLAGQVADVAVVRVAVAADCAARGIVTSSVELFTEIGCKADIVTSATVGALPVLVVTCPVIEAGDWLVPTGAVKGTFPRALPGWTPVIMVAA